MSSEKYLEKNLVVGPFQCNCRLIVCPKTGHGILVDPGDEAEKILNTVSQAKTPSGAPIEIRYLLHTHGHLDHVGAARPVKEMLSTHPQIALHKGDEPLYLALQTQGRLFGLQYDNPLPVDHYLEDGEELKVGELKFSVVHTPGHSPGSVCLRLHEDSGLQIPETVFSGDTLFQGSVGRTDLWGANQDQMFKSIRQRIFSLDDDTRVCPGHGPETRIGIEKRENPFLN
jgi:glyoxylase-like metal-dependent hydrolase (beta-lactamase superfamily II)